MRGRCCIWSAATRWVCGSASDQGRDDAHEAIGAKFLARWFGPEVSEPVRLHVQAKRYLCRVQPDYLDNLSPLSQRTLQIQGGPMTEEEARAFEHLPFFEDAVRLRRWDEAGKEAQMQTLPFAHFMRLATAHMLGQGDEQGVVPVV
jgi:gamma-butyrobetaine dioxygenase